MNKVKITVLRTNFFEDFAKEYGCEGLGECELHAEGQVYYSNGWEKPDGLCDNAWKSMLEYVMTLAHGGRDIYAGGWMNCDDAVLVSCNDGIRPVVFKVEATDEEAPVWTHDIENSKTSHFE